MNSFKFLFVWETLYSFYSEGEYPALLDRVFLAAYVSHSLIRSCHFLLACQVSMNRSAVTLFVLSYKLGISFVLLFLGFFSLYFGNLTMICLGVGLLLLILMGILCASWI